MSQYLAFKEELISQIPALQLLQAMGYRYLTPAEALARHYGPKYLQQYANEYAFRFSKPQERHADV
jgi:hypothetical protein